MSSSETASENRILPVGRPIHCGPNVQTSDHWIHDKQTGQAKRAGTHRPAGYWHKTEKARSAQQ